MHRGDVSLLSPGRLALLKDQDIKKKKVAVNAEFLRVGTTCVLAC
jgi:hypothetical protein